MKITKVDAIQIEDKPADQPGWRPIVCRVYTDTGLYGDTFLLIQITRRQIKDRYLRDLPLLLR